MFKKMPNIEMPNGEFIEQNAIKRLRDGAIVPFNSELPDYQDYLKWLEEGNTPEPPDEDEVDNG